MTWALLYTTLLVALIVRVRSGDDTGPPEPILPIWGEPLWLTRLHHRLFLVLLVGPPIERIFVAGAPTGRGLGAALFIAGVVLYRVAGRTLGDALSPFIEPRRSAPLVTAGLY